MKDVYVLLLFFLAPIYGFFIYALIHPIYLLMFPKFAKDDGDENGAFYASMYQSMGEP